MGDDPRTMPALALILLIAIGVVLYREFEKARRRNDTVVVPAPDRPTPPRHQRVTDTELARRTRAVRDAVRSGAITAEDAAKSLARTCGLELADARARVRGLNPSADDETS